MAEENIRSSSVEENRSRGKRRLEDYSVFNKLPTEYQDYKLFYYDMSKANNKCLFCRNKEEEGELLEHSNHFICDYCVEYLKEIEEGKKSEKYFEVESGSSVLPYYHNGSDGIGWAYMIILDRVNFSIDFGDEGNTTLFDRKELALVYGISHLLELIKINSKL